MKGDPVCRQYAPAPIGRRLPGLCGVEPGGRVHVTIRLQARQYEGLRMPWYPGTYACDECPNPSRGLVQACLWGRVKRVVRAPMLQSAYLSQVYGPLFLGLP